MVHNVDEGEMAFQARAMAFRRLAGPSSRCPVLVQSFATDAPKRGGGLQDVVLGSAAAGGSGFPFGAAAAVAAAAADGAPRYKGATFDKKSGRWRATITVNKEKVDLGLFDDAKTASDAYFVAKAVYSEKQYKRKPRHASGTAAAAATDAPASAPSPGSVPEGYEVEEVQIPAMVIDVDDTDDDEAGAATTPPTPPGGGASDRRASSRYRGVIQEGPGATLWEAVVVDTNGREISGGEYEAEEEAARAYDALARMYLGPEAPTNFTADAYTSWVHPDAVLHTGQIETRPGVPLTLEEVLDALKQERGVDVAAVDIRGKSELGDHLVFVTGSSTAHMRRMADTISRALRKRRLPGVDPTVEAREMDDWMVVDCSNIIVNVFDPEAREVFDLENMYKNMKPGEDPNHGMTYEEWLQKNPIPDKWLKRLERDEEELEAAQRTAKLR